MAGKVAAFAHFGAKLKNDTWSWSAVTPDGSTVILQLWKERLNYTTDPISYSEFGNPHLIEDGERLGNHQRIKDLCWARDNCDGLFRVVVGVPKDANKRPRQTGEAYPQKTLIMKLIELDETTGEFRAEAIVK